MGSVGALVTVFDNGRLWRIGKQGHLEAGQNHKYVAALQIEFQGHIFNEQLAGLSHRCAAALVESEELFVHLAHGHKNVTEFMGQVAQVLVNTRGELLQAFWFDRWNGFEHVKHQLFGNSLWIGHFVSPLKERLKEYLGTDTAGYDNTIFIEFVKS